MSYSTPPLTQEPQGPHGPTQRQDVDSLFKQLGAGGTQGPTGDIDEIFKQEGYRQSEEAQSLAEGAALFGKHAVKLFADGTARLAGGFAKAAGATATAMLGEGFGPGWDFVGDMLKSGTGTTDPDSLDAIQGIAKQVGIINDTELDVGKKFDEKVRRRIGNWAIGSETIGTLGSMMIGPVAEFGKLGSVAAKPAAAFLERTLMRAASKGVAERGMVDTLLAQGRAWDWLAKNPQWQMSASIFERLAAAGGRNINDLLGTTAAFMAMNYAVSPDSERAHAALHAAQTAWMMVPIARVGQALAARLVQGGMTSEQVQASKRVYDQLYDGRLSLPEADAAFKELMPGGLRMGVANAVSVAGESAAFLTITPDAHDLLKRGIAGDTDALGKLSAMYFGTMAGLMVGKYALPQDLAPLFKHVRPDLNTLNTYIEAEANKLVAEGPEPGGPGAQQWETTRRHLDESERETRARYGWANNETRAILRAGWEPSFRDPNSSDVWLDHGKDFHVLLSQGTEGQPSLQFSENVAKVLREAGRDPDAHSALTSPGMRTATGEGAHRVLDDLALVAAGRQMQGDLTYTRLGFREVMPGTWSYDAGDLHYKMQIDGTSATKRPLDYTWTGSEDVVTVSGYGASKWEHQTMWALEQAMIAKEAMAPDPLVDGILGQAITMARHSDSIGAGQLRAFFESQPPEAMAPMLRPEFDEYFALLLGSLASGNSNAPATALDLATPPPEKLSRGIFQQKATDAVPEIQPWQQGQAPPPERPGVGQATGEPPLSSGVMRGVGQERLPTEAGEPPVGGMAEPQPVAPRVTLSERLDPHDIPPEPKSRSSESGMIDLPTLDDIRAAADRGWEALRNLAQDLTWVGGEKGGKARAVLGNVLQEAERRAKTDQNFGAIINDITEAMAKVDERGPLWSQKSTGGTTRQWFARAVASAAVPRNQFGGMKVMATPEGVESNSTGFWWTELHQIGNNAIHPDDMVRAQQVLADIGGKLAEAKQQWTAQRDYYERGGKPLGDAGADLEKKFPNWAGMMPKLKKGEHAILANNTLDAIRQSERLLKQVEQKLATRREEGIGVEYTKPTLSERLDPHDMPPEPGSEMVAGSAGAVLKDVGKGAGKAAGEVGEFFMERADRLDAAVKNDPTGFVEKGRMALSKGEKVAAEAREAAKPALKAFKGKWAREVVYLNPAKPEQGTVPAHVDIGDMRTPGKTPLEKKFAAGMQAALEVPWQAGVEASATRPRKNKQTGEVESQFMEPGGKRVMPREPGRDADEVFGTKALRQELFDVWAENNTNTVPDGKGGRRPETGADIEAAWVKKFGDAKVDLAESEAAIEFMRRYEKVPYTWKGKKVFESNVKKALTRTLHRQAQRIGVISEFGQGMSEGDRARLIKEATAAGNKKRVADLTSKRGIDEALGKFKEQVTDTGSEVKNQFVRRMAQEYAEFLQGRTPEGSQASGSMLSKIIRSVNAVRRAGLTAFKTGTFDVLEVFTRPWSNFGAVGRFRTVRAIWQYAKSPIESVRYAKRMATIDQDMMTGMWDSAGDLLDTYGEYANLTNNVLEKVKGAVFTRVADVMLAEWKAGKATIGDRQVVKSLLKLTPQQESDLLSGKASRDVQQLFRRSAVRYLTSRKTAAESTRFASNQGLQQWFLFGKWASNRAADNLKVFMALKQAVRDGGWHSKEAGVAALRVGKVMLGLAVSGAVAQALSYGLMDLISDEPAFKRYLRELSEAPTQMLLKAFGTQLVGGPVGQAVMAGFDKAQDAEHKIASLTTVGSAALAIIEGSKELRKGDWAGLHHMASDVGAIPYPLAPMLQAWGSTKNTTLRNDTKMVSSWKKLNDIPQETGARTKPDEFYDAIDRIINHIDAANGDNKAAFLAAMADIRQAQGLSGKDSVASLIDGKRLTPGLSIEQQADLAEFVNDDQRMMRIYQHDEAMHEFAKMVRKLEGDPPHPLDAELGLVEAQARLGSSQQWNNIADQAVENATQRLVAGEALGSEIDDVAMSMAKFPHQLQGVVPDRVLRGLQNPNLDTTARARRIAAILRNRARDRRTDARKEAVKERRENR